MDKETVILVAAICILISFILSGVSRILMFKKHVRNMQEMHPNLRYHAGLQVGAILVELLAPLLIVLFLTVNTYDTPSDFLSMSSLFACIILSLVTASAAAIDNSFDLSKPFYENKPVYNKVSQLGGLLLLGVASA